MKKKETVLPFAHRRMLVLVLLTLAAGLLAWRGVHLQVVEREFLQVQGDSRYLRDITMVAHRGVISDRNGESLAVSTPIRSVCANPQELIGQSKHFSQLAQLLDVDVDYLQRRVAKRSQREFIFLKRHVPPEVADKVAALEVPGVFLRKEYKRYYPTGEVSAHIIGFTDIDDRGQEGIELAYDQWLQGSAGVKRIIQDRLGRVVENVARIQPMQPGNNLKLSIDRRLQYLAYRELKSAMLQHQAKAASAVLLDVETGEILAMVNQPAYNPNDRKQRGSERLRNRAITDVFEPGSTLKPFTIAAALESGHYQPTTPIDTSPGTFRVGRNIVRDMRNYGMLDVGKVITKSSNVGSSKIAMSLDPDHLWKTYDAMGFGKLSGIGFPGEIPGILTHHSRWHPIEQATLAFGYGLNVTTLQLAQAYAILASDGVRRPSSLLRVEQSPQGERVLSKTVARDVRAMLETVVSSAGTGRRADVPGYRIAGKTGTVHKSTAGGYSEDRYVSVFAGMAPASQPRLVMVVMVNEPGGEQYYGGQVAAPVFARVMEGALHTLNVAPDGVSLVKGDKRLQRGRS